MPTKTKQSETKKIPTSVKTMAGKPKLRFAGFSGEPSSAEATAGNWEEKRLGDVSLNIMYGLNSSAVKFDGVNKYIRITDIDEDTNKFVPKPLTSPDNILGEEFKVKENDILFTRTGASVGKSYLYNKKDGDLYFAGFLIKFNINKANSKFVFYNTLRYYYKKWVSVMSLRSGQPGINAEEYKKLKINIPSLPEQQKIAEFLGAVDEWIENLRTQKESLEEYKKGMMQKIFSQEVRFKDDDGNNFAEWEERKLGEIFSIVAGRTKSKYISDVGKNIIVDMGGISTDGKLIAKKRTNHSKDFLTQNDLVMPKDDIGGGYIIGRVAQIPLNNKYICGDHIYKLTRKNGVITFMYYMINSYEVNKCFRRKANGTAQLGLSKKEVENQIVNCPTIPEQQKIAEFLTSLDNLIESKQQQITQAEKWKKGLMQGLFV